MISFGDGNRGFQVGQSYGSISAEIHLPPERPETPPSPSAAIPFRRDPDFVDRGTLLDQIREKCFAPASRIALVGLGGVGKSQLAIEYCHRTTDRSPETWIFWVHASNAARLEQSYRDIADQIKLLGRKDPQADIFKLVHNWLRNEKNGKWILVLDNLDDAAVLLTTPTNSRKAQASGGDNTPIHHLSTYLPQTKNGSILVTSRTRSVALKLVDDSDIIQVEPMGNTDALELLQTKLGEQVIQDGITELAAALEFMPLALVQAAAYIRKRAPRCSVRQYLAEFHKSDGRKTSLLNYEAGHLRRDEEAKNSIITTWQISFDYISQNKPSAAGLLSLMSFFDRQGIPEALLKIQDSPGNRVVKRDVRSDRYSSCENNGENAGSECGIDYDLEDDIDTLRSYSFITANIDGRTFEMHGLVQLATRKWLQAHNQLERWKQQYIKNLCTAFPTGNHENWRICQELFPHARSAEAQRPATESSLREWATILHNAAWYALAMGKYTEAERMSAEAARSREKVLGGEHAGTLGSRGMLASTFWNQGRWKEAEELFLFVQVMETSSRVLGPEHPDTLTIMANLAFTIKSQSHNDEAISLMGKCVQLQKQIFGSQHPQTKTSVKALNEWQMLNIVTER
ncbi:hypothetical protein K432DRAFT_343643 [Lepidopterella palustris CBS 459.81]|uniref:NB-ARC domain-containing protein n=1 Tax=Lepidopterella palustris CBS 459.81 TaxID=1314670 RepID=A0A8E2EJR2_9PEZI|nr:hypothetical protein K432DRAFT_343643 [Lepidopterella palustris CBS 459.81]